MHAALLALAAALAASAHAARVVGLDLAGLRSRDALAKRVDVIVELPGTLRAFQGLDGLDAAERRTLVGATLIQSHGRAQARVMSLLNSLQATSFAPETSVEQFWITNTILVRDATLPIIDALLAHPDVMEIRPDRAIASISPVTYHQTGDLREEAAAGELWPLLQIRVPEAWNITRGEGVVVANIDTGVRFSHVAVKESYRGYDSRTGATIHDYNWFDPKARDTFPSDPNGHGSHTMGNIVGSSSAVPSAFGVAPGAQWIAARGCSSSSCSEADLTASAQFVLCPARLDRTAVDCSLGANVVSNSWGGGRGQTFYKSYVDAWRAAGIIPVFSAGNSGPSCSTANSPADLATVLSIGSTAESRALSSFSSRGPGVTTPGFSTEKPDISAPGERVLSISPSSDTATATLSGTSMAAPHISGVVALVMSAFKKTNARFPTYDEVYAILTSTASKNVGKPAGTATQCAGKGYDVFPNYFYGYGIVDAAEAVKAAAKRV